MHWATINAMMSGRCMDIAYSTRSYIKRGLIASVLQT